MQYGLDKPLPVQYVELMRGIFGGSVECFSTCGNLRAEFLHRLPVTAWLALGATLLAAALARRWRCCACGSTAAGWTACCSASRRPALRPDARAVDGAVDLLSGEAELFPYEGYIPLHEDPGRLGLAPRAAVDRRRPPFAGAVRPVLRAAMLEARSADWVRTARGKGLRERRVVWRHMLRASLAAPVSILGLDLSHAFGGYVLYVETIFRVPGVGALAESGHPRSRPPRRRRHDCLARDHRRRRQRGARHRRPHPGPARPPAPDGLRPRVASPQVSR